jgi:hypothetical protein
MKWNVRCHMIILSISSIPGLLIPGQIPEA